MATYIGFMGNLRPKSMDRNDIKDVLGWQAEGARKARSAGFDIVYVYAGMGYLGYEFLLPEYNHRGDEYGGGIENRVRFVREMLEVTRDAVGTDCGVALRVSLEELRGRPGEHHESEAHALVALLSDHADLFDVKMDSSPTDCSASRFTGEGSHEPVIDFVKRMTDKPVVGVGRFTSPDTMVSQLKRGVLDLIGGARPSIADPFLPAKLREGAVKPRMVSAALTMPMRRGRPSAKTLTPSSRRPALSVRRGFVRYRHRLASPTWTPGRGYRWPGAPAGGDDFLNQ